MQTGGKTKNIHNGYHGFAGYPKFGKAGSGGPEDTVIILNLPLSYLYNTDDLI